ncbi:type I-A CRISPR-associated protein Cas5a [Methanocaldococcus jannaschii]|nr:type I-A CRISPR-associated protein Cas5a [Methanocaldococcus jannaschii]
MEALVALLRFPFYSFGKQSYQVRQSLLLPSPSALKGALAKGIILLGGKKGKSLDEIAKKTVEELENKLIYVGAKPYKSSIIKTPILLKRLRNLEDQKNPEKSDAMRREYVFAREILAIYVFRRKLSEEEKDLMLKAVYLIDQLGDTECVGNVIKTEWVEVKEEKAPLKTYVKFKKVSKMSINGGIIENMLETPNFGNKVKEEPYLLPLIEKRYRRSSYYVESDRIFDGNYKIIAFDEVIGLWI